MDPAAAQRPAPRVIPLTEPAPRLMVLIPALNEAGRIGAVVAEVRGRQPHAEVVVVDDGSTDETAAEAREAGAVVLGHSYQMGYGAALQTGYKYALRQGHSLVVQMDGDGQHPPAEIDRLLERLGRGDVDFVVGSRFLGRGSYRMPPVRRLGSQLFSKLTSTILGRPVTDPTSGFQALNVRTLRLYRQDFYPYDYPDADILIRADYHGLRFAEVPVQMLPGIPGKSMHSGLKPAYYVYKLLLSIFLACITGRPQEEGAAPDRGPR